MRVDNLPKQDKLTGAQVVIDYPHHEIHGGNLYTVVHSDATVANGADHDLQVTVGSRDLHLTLFISVSGAGTLTLTEGHTSTGGTGVTAYNMCRASANTTTATWVHTPGSVSGGTVLMTRYLAGGEGPKSAGTSSRTGLEWNLAPGTKYLVRWNNSSGGEKIATTEVNYYEE